MWEMFSREIPYPGMWPFQVANSVVKDGLRPPMMPNCPLESLIVQCWDQDPNLRPDFATIVDILEALSNVVGPIPVDESGKPTDVELDDEERQYLYQKINSIICRGLSSQQSDGSTLRGSIRFLNRVIVPRSGSPALPPASHVLQAPSSTSPHSPSVDPAHQYSSSPLPSSPGSGERRYSATPPPPSFPHLSPETRTQSDLSEGAISPRQMQPHQLADQLQNQDLTINSRIRIRNPTRSPSDAHLPSLSSAPIAPGGHLPARSSPSSPIPPSPFSGALPSQYASSSSSSSSSSSPTVSPSPLYSSTPVNAPQVMERCMTCGQPIYEKAVRVKIGSFHQTCIVCFHCKSRPTTRILRHEDNLFCSDACVKASTPPCAACSRPIEGECLGWLNKRWHKACFVCTRCRRPMDKIFEIAGYPYCLQCCQPR